MNAVIQNMIDRHSCRSFTEQKVEREKLEDLVTAAIYAPSGMNKQTWHFIFLTDREKIQKLAAAVREADNRPAGYNFYDPDVFFIVSGERDNRNCMLDGSAAIENVLLAATSLGLGSCWINQVRDTCDDPKVRALLTEFGMPEDHIVNAAASIGYAAQEPVLHERRENTVSIVD